MYSFHIIKEVAKNQLAKLPLLRKISAIFHHNTGINGDPQLVQEIFVQYNRITPVRGKRVLELGPGHTYQLMETALAQGAAKAAIIDINKQIADEVIAKTGIEYTIYAGNAMPYPDESFDFIWSHTVYEHLRFPETTVKETFRVLTPGGVALHHIDMRDHLILDEANPNTFDMLKFSNRLWNRMSWNRSIYVNRLRLSHWIELHNKAGFLVSVHETFTSKAAGEAYEKNSLPYLRRYSETDATTSQVFLSITKPVKAK